MKTSGVIVGPGGNEDWKLNRKSELHRSLLDDVSLEAGLIISSFANLQLYIPKYSFLAFDWWWTRPEVQHLVKSKRGACVCFCSNSKCVTCGAGNISSLCSIVWPWQPKHMFHAQKRACWSNPCEKKRMITTYGNCDIWAESARSVIKDAMNRLVEELCSWSCVLPSFPYSSLLNESCSLMTSSSLPLLSPFPSLCRASSHNPRGDAGERERLRAPCDDQRALERPWQPIICLLVASCLASHFSRVPFLIFLPGELFHVWNGLVVFLCPDMLRESDSDRSALCLLVGLKSAEPCFPAPCRRSNVQKNR